MAEANVKVEIEFTAGVWTNVSTHLKSGSTRRGKARATGKSTVGTATVTMRNELRQFDPEYSGNVSPGNLTVDKGIRITAQYGATWYPVFTGQIDRIIQRYIGPNDAIATLVCSDGLAKLSTDVLGSPWEVDVPKLAPTCWYRLGEAEGPLAVDRIAGRYGVYVGSPTFGADGLIDHDDDDAVTFTATENYLVIPPGAFPVGVNWGIGFMLNVPAAPPVGQIIMLMFDVNYPNGLAVWMDSNGFIHARVYDNGVINYARSTVSFALNNYFVNIVKSAVGPPFIHIMSGGIDWTHAASALGTGGTLRSTHYVVGAQAFPFTIDELMTWDYIPTDVQLFTLNFAAGGWLVDGVQSRINRVLDAANWDAAARDIGGQWDDNLRGTDLKTSALAHIESIARTAEARMPFVERDGTLRVLDRQASLIYPYTQSVATIGDGAGEIPYTEVGDYSLDMDMVENVVHRRWTTAYEEREFLIEATDFDGIAASDRRRVGDEIFSEYVTPEYEYSLASFRMAKMRRKLPYVDSLEISPRKDPDTIFPVILNLELSDRLTWKRRPQNVGTAIEREVILEGINHDFGPKRWKTTLLVDATDAFKVFLFSTAGGTTRTLWGSEDWRFSGGL